MSNTASDGRFSTAVGDAPVTPYQKAAQAWDERIGSARVQAKNWRLAAFIGFGTTALLVGALVYQAGQAKVTPFMVQVDGRGAVVGAGRVQRRPLQVNDQMVRYFMANIVTDMRTLPLDPVIAKEAWLKMYKFLGPAAVQKMNAIAQANDPFAGVGERTRTVEIDAITALTEDTRQIRWRENTYSANGGFLSADTYTGVFTYKIQQSEDLGQLNVNPLGIVITSFDITKDAI